MRTGQRLAALDGLRGLAVLAVLAAHTGIPGLRGGFIGVDVFFVLSGFLITSLLLHEHASAGRVDLAAFWARRARRLLPGALVMITAVVTARPLWPPDAVDRLRDDATSAMLWVSNWRWALGGTDYFARGGTISPLQHTWSLAVEEQFYLLWPCLLVTLWLGARTELFRRRRLVLLAGLGAGLSALATTIGSGRVAPGRLYFGTDTRAQQLLIGAVLAGLLLPTWQLRNSPRRAQRSTQPGAGRSMPLLLSATGLAVLAAAAHLATGAPAQFGHGLMTLTAAASAALIAGLMLDGRTVLSALFGSRPLVALGRVSYDIYLWHWPVFEAVNGAHTGLSGYPLAGLRLGVTLGLATASFLLVRLPSQWLRAQPRRLLPLAATGVLAALTFTACTTPTTQPSTPASSALDQPPPTSPTGHQPSAGRSSAASVSRKSTRTPGPLTVDVFGDSIGWTLTHYLPATPGIVFIDHTILGCGVVDGGPYRYFGQDYPDQPACDNLPAQWQSQVTADRPDEALLIVGRWETMDRKFAGQWTQVGQALFDSHLSALLTDALNRLGSTGARVIVTTEPYNRRGEQPDGQPYPEDNPARVDSWNQLLRQAVSARPGTGLLDLNAQLCPAGTFTWKVQGVRVRSDGVHLSVDGVRWLTPWLTQQLRAATG